MLYPNSLPNGGKIGVIAPAFGPGMEPYISRHIAAKYTFENLGYTIEEGPNLYETCGIGKTNTPEKCAEEFMSFYLNDSDVLISAGGGETMCEDIPFVDWDKIRSSKPKWFMGYSDNSNFTYMLTTVCDTAAIYGPCFSEFGMRKWHDSLFSALSLLKGDNLSVVGYEKFELNSLDAQIDPLCEYNLTENKRLVYSGNYKEGDSFEGRLIGGCVDCLVTLIGTKHDKTLDFIERYKADGFVWFLECCDLNVFSIRRAFWQMSEAGWFEYCKGFIIGRPRIFNEPMMGLDQYEAVMGILGQYNVPVIMDCDIGHLSPMMPIISGAIGIVTTRNGNINLDMRLE